MKTEQFPVQYWISVHERIRKDIRRYVVILITVTLVSLIQGWNRLQEMNRGYQIAREFTLLKIKDNPIDEVARAFAFNCRKKVPGCADGKISVRLENIPDVGWEYEQYLNKNLPSGYFNFSGYKLGLASFGMLMLIAPSLLLLLIFLKIHTLRKISKMLSSEAVEYGEVQQCLNSVFNERATKNLGEHRWYYATFWAVALLAVALVGPMMYETMNLDRHINTEVVIDKLGYLTALPDVPLENRTKLLPDGKLPYHRYIDFRDFMTIIIAILIWLSLIHQLNPRHGALPVEDKSQT